MRDHVAPLDDAVHNVVGIILLIRSKRLQNKRADAFIMLQRTDDTTIIINSTIVSPDRETFPQISQPKPKLYWNSPPSPPAEQWEHIDQDSIDHHSDQSKPDADRNRFMPSHRKYKH